jgi:GNAT superfamily N-acetyltransferase
VDNTISIRKATLDDVAELVRLRRMMFEAMGYGDARRLDASDAASADYFSRTISGGVFHAWLAETSNDEAIGSAGAVIDQHPPDPANLSGQTGYIMNLVTDPRYRRQGIARRLMQTILDWLAEQGITHMTLHTTQAGYSLYEELGFVESNEMRLRLE